jgi:hypothetical protein
VQSHATRASRKAKKAEQTNRTTMKEQRPRPELVEQYSDSDSSPESEEDSVCSFALRERRRMNRKDDEISWSDKSADDRAKASTNQRSERENMLAESEVDTDASHSNHASNRERERGSEVIERNRTSGADLREKREEGQPGYSLRPRIRRNYKE